MNASENNEINDSRTTAQLCGVSFSKFKKTHVKKEFMKSLIESKVEPACYWAAELICANHYIDVWESIILFATKYVHLGNPKLPIYISLRIGIFKELLDNHEGDEINLRNNFTIRQLFAELISTLCFSRKNHKIELVKINKNEDFSMESIKKMLKAPDVSYGTPIFKQEDPKELFIAINKLAYHLSNESKNSYNACYWLEWIIEFDITCKKNKQLSISERREWVNVDEKYKSDSIWIVWDLIFMCAEKKNCIATSKIIDALLVIFCLKYTTSVKRKRKYILYNCISLLTDSCNLDIPIWKDKAQILNVSKKINIIYKEIKKNEEPCEKSDDKLKEPCKQERTNLNKTIEKIDMMNALIGVK